MARIDLFVWNFSKRLHETYCPFNSSVVSVTVHSLRYPWNPRGHRSTRNVIQFDFVKGPFEI